MSGSWYCTFWLTVTLSWLTGTLEQNSTIIYITCTFPTATSQNVCCEEGLMASSLLKFSFFILHTTICFFVCTNERSTIDTSEERLSKSVCCCWFSSKRHAEDTALRTCEMPWMAGDVIILPASGKQLHKSLEQEWGNFTGVSPGRKRRSHMDNCC